MGDIADRISGWRSDGLIDADTADRLLATLPPGDDAPDDAVHRPGDVSPSFGAVFGPGVTVPEALVYLGIGFVAAAWTASISYLAADDPGSTAIMFIGSLASALAFAAIFLALRPGDQRRRRAAGVAALASVGYAGLASWSVFNALVGVGNPLTPVLAGLATAIVAVGFRLIHAALTTQYGVLASATALAAALLNFAIVRIFGEASFDTPGSDGTFAQLIVQTVWWAMVGIGFGVVGHLESADSDDPSALRRAGLTRFWAGLVLIVGISSALTRSGQIGQGAEYGRLVTPWVADLVIIVASVLLLERALRRGSGGFLAGGALGLVIALSDLSGSYLRAATGVGLLIEGLILLAIGFGVYRLRPGLEQPPDLPVDPPALGAASDPVPDGAVPDAAVPPNGD